MLIILFLCSLICMDFVNVSDFSVSLLLYKAHTSIYSNAYRNISSHLPLISLKNHLYCLPGVLSI